MDSKLMLKRDSNDWSTLSDFDSAPYPAGARSSLAKISAKFYFSPDPRDWGSSVSPDFIESDDEFYNLVPTEKRPWRPKDTLSPRGLGNAGCVILLIAGLLLLFIGYPVLTFYDRTKFDTGGAFNVGGINSTGQIPLIGNFGLIDQDTPREAYTRPSWVSGQQDMQLVFSDEFNVDGRTFYPGDDPYWEAVDLHYWATNNLEWYDPEAITTQDGSLVITFSQKQTHGLNYEGGLLSTWNKFCFTGGYIETSVQLPGASNVAGLWPAIWAMGNLGRAGYGASLEGLWPYSYDSCDVGTVANQTVNGQPVAATINGDASKGGVLSYMPGQRLSRCTCSGESHPGPKHPDGTFVGRSAPEIDIFEAQSSGSGVGEVSQSAQWAPFDAGYLWNSTAENMIIADLTTSKLNTYIGSATQQATSVVTNTNSNCYELGTGCYSVYGFEYKPGFDDGYITWISSNQVAWTMKAAGVGPDPSVQISARPVSQEPMYIIANLGMSTSFGAVDLTALAFPAHMKIDYVRVYQPANAVNIGCNPRDFPTKDYIDKYIEAYTNPNLTTWEDDYHQSWPKSSFLDQC
ncbi:unnamed protein product [Cyclocybe aegerita]|uniref:GH16 domain-containing protein n=1 Tax=Cyclocybe aegerita TaxID=1973307 RepID=A0A8S0VRE1_CYCAE|nr:unnamed protein product [Cyclocybe aegerita]